MTLEYLTQNWALAIASVLGTAVLLFVIYRVLQDSARGRLQEMVRQLRRREKDDKAARRAADKALAKLEQLQARADSVKPRQVQAAREALEEAREIQKLVDDQVLIARHDVRTLILQEYAPKRHAAMRKKYLQEST